MITPVEDADLEVLDPSWEPVDLDPVLNGTHTVAVPTLGLRDDDVGLFYRGRTNGIHADSGIGKTWIAAIVAAQELAAGHPVLWIHLEDPDAGLLVDRLRSLGVTDQQLRGLLDYRQPSVPFYDAALASIEDAIRTFDITLVVLDSLGEAFGIAGIDENKDLDVGYWFRRVARRLEATGAGILLVDHGTKAADNPLHPSGSKRKRAAITGASYLVEAVRPLTRDAGGTLRLVTAKDRAGWHARGAEAARVELTIWPDGGMTAHVVAPSQRAMQSPNARLEALAGSAVDAAKTLGRPASKRELVELIDTRARAEAKRAAIDFAVAEGALRTESGTRGAVMHIYVRDLSGDTPGGPQ